jgi:hypothetical protein
MKPLLIIVLLLTLPSCGYQHFTKPGVSSYTQQEDEMRCESLAYQQATALHGQNSMIELAVLPRKSECMQRLGYTGVR